MCIAITTGVHVLVLTTKCRGSRRGWREAYDNLLTVCFYKVPAAVVPQAIVLKDGGVADPDLVLNEVHALRV